MDVQAMLVENAAGQLREAFLGCNGRVLAQAREIRIRQGLPLVVRALDGEFFIGPKGDVLTGPQGAFIPAGRHVGDMLEKLSGYSLYAFDTEIKNGYITIAGGHRVGICGRVTVEDGRIKTMKHISGLTIRVAREVVGAADEVYSIISEPVRNCVFVSPPGCGKTTMLRDVVRRLSNDGFNVAVVDERSEIGGCHMGVAQKDLGPRTDVLDAAPKAAGMMLALRVLSPQVIAVDEIGGVEDAEAIGAAAQSGVAVLCSLHGRNIEDVRRRAALRPLLENKVFERYIFLSDKPRPGTVVGIYDENFERVG